MLNAEEVKRHTNFFIPFIVRIPFQLPFQSTQHYIPGKLTKLSNFSMAICWKLVKSHSKRKVEHKADSFYAYHCHPSIVPCYSQQTTSHSKVSTLDSAFAIFIYIIILNRLLLSLRVWQWLSKVYFLLVKWKTVITNPNDSFAILFKNAYSLDKRSDRRHNPFRMSGQRKQFDWRLSDRYVAWDG